jgi:hypothetical protein
MILEKKYSKVCSGSSRNMSLAVGDISSPSSELDLHHHTTGRSYSILA